jgi:hypothetical protein
MHATIVSYVLAKELENIGEDTEKQIWKIMQIQRQLLL